jgi:hypothetical protein
MAAETISRERVVASDARRRRLHETAAISASTSATADRNRRARITILIVIVENYPDPRISARLYSV